MCLWVELFVESYKALEYAALCCYCSLFYIFRTPRHVVCQRFLAADDNWYRAVVVDIGEDEVRVLYADYGNTEKVPVSRILPIPTHLLQLPFKVIRCTLTGEATGTARPFLCVSTILHPLHPQVGNTFPLTGRRMCCSCSRARCLGSSPPYSPSMAPMSFPLSCLRRGVVVTSVP